MTLRLHKWENVLGVENIDPLIAPTKDGKNNIYFRYRTFSDPKQSGRFFIISIWCEKLSK